MDLSQQRGKILQEFTKKQKHHLDEWSEKAMQAYLEFGRKYTEDMYSTNLLMIDGVCNDSQEQLIILENLFKNLTQTRGQIKHHQRVAYSIARKQYMDNALSKFFRGWKQQSKYQRYIHRMTVYASNYAKFRIPKALFISWRKSTRDASRSLVLQQVNRKTDKEIMMMQKEYEQLISQLEGVLEKKLIELRVEEEQHKELVNRYEGIVEKRATLKH